MRTQPRQGEIPFAMDADGKLYATNPADLKKIEALPFPRTGQQDRRAATGGDTEKLGPCNAEGFAVGLDVRNCPADRRQAGRSSPHDRAEYGLRIGRCRARSRRDHPAIEQNDPQPFRPDERSGKSGPRRPFGPRSGCFKRRIRHARPGIQSHGAGPQRESEAPGRTGAHAQRAGDVPQDPGRAAAAADRSAPGPSRSKASPFPPRKWAATFSTISRCPAGPWRC